MCLETFEKPGDLYLARVDEVNPLRPLYTGDVVADVAIPGVQDRGTEAARSRTTTRIAASTCSGCGGSGSGRRRVRGLEVKRVSPCAGLPSSDPLSSLCREPAAVAVDWSLPSPR